MPHPSASFVVPCYNYGCYLRECLDSILSQVDHSDVEVIAINDCSSDDTASILDSYRHDARVRVIHHSDNKGHLYSVEEGFRLATAPFVARIDADDRLRPNFLATLLPIFEKWPNVGFVYGDAAMINRDSVVVCERFEQPHGGQSFAGWALPDILAKNYICAPTAIARRESWLKNLPIWEGLAFNDIYFNMMIARDWDFGYEPVVVADYRVHGTNWHSRITLDKTEEPSLFRVLDWVFAHPESEPKHELTKQSIKKSVYAAHYLDLAEKYFGVGYNTDARRCYLHAFRHRQGLMFKLGPVRRFAATMFGRATYERLKKVLKRKQIATSEATQSFVIKKSYE